LLMLPTEDRLLAILPDESLPVLASLAPVFTHPTGLPEGRRVGAITWPAKAGWTSSDALAAVRRWVWAEGVFAPRGGGSVVEELPPPWREVLGAARAPAA